MERRADPEQRRRHIAEALWRIAASRGLHDVGLREIAAEADVSLGALQHWFAGKDEVLLATLRLVGQEAERRVRTRLAELDTPPSPQAVVRGTLAEMLPLTEESRTGLLVHVAYLARAVHDSRLRDVTAGGLDPLRDLLAEMLRRSADAGELAAGRDPETEAMTLICLADGVTNHVLLGVLTPDDGRRLVEAHLAGLFAGSTTPAPAAD